MLVPLIGMDATVFLRFVRMCRNMFLTLCITGVGILLPVNLSKYTEYKGSKGSDWVVNITPLTVWAPAIWSQVVIAWVFNFVVMGFLWFNYKKVHELRRKYFESEEYQKSLHSRTLMVRKMSNQKAIAYLLSRRFLIFLRRVAPTKVLPGSSIRSPLTHPLLEPLLPETSRSFLILSSNTTTPFASLRRS